MHLVSKVKEYIRKENLLTKGDKVVVGVSGGADSVTLLCVLYALQYELGFSLHVAHYNHKLRPSADKDEQFVIQLAQELGVSYTVESWKNKSKKLDGSLEEAAREQRLDFFKKVVCKQKATKIALAHTVNDLAETVLMRILRGSGLQGLRAILPLRKINGNIFIRPLLEVKRKDVERYLKEKKASFRIDPTNKQTKFFRNKVRLELLPLLRKEYNKNISQVLSYFSKNVTLDYNYLEIQAKKQFKRLAVCQEKKKVSFLKEPFMKQHQAIQRMLIRLGIRFLKGDINGLTLTHIQEIEDLIVHRPNGSIVDLSGSMKIKNMNTEFVLFLPAFHHE